MIRYVTIGGALAAAALLGGCDRKGDGTSVTINAADGNMVGHVDGRSGEIKLALPGFTGEFKLPKVKMDADNFDLNGVHLYPGSTIGAINLNGDKGDGRSSDGQLQLHFTSPADAATVRGWFQQRLEKAGFTLHTDGNGLAGTTDENKPFRLDLKDTGRQRAEGTIVLGG